MSKNSNNKPSPNKKKAKDHNEDNKFTKPVLKVVQFEDLILGEGLESQAIFTQYEDISDY